MVKKCCVPNCRGNYSSTDKVSVFLFPRDPTRRALWLSKIPRADFVPSGESVVCAKHFDEQFIVKIDSVTRPDGSVLTVPRDKVKLRDDAYPTDSCVDMKPKLVSAIRIFPDMHVEIFVVRGNNGIGK